MWIIHPDAGFFSIVEGDPQFRDSKGKLQVRARARDDLDRLRQYIPELGPTIETPHGDYAYRAICDRHILGDSFGLMISGIDYRNMKNRVRDQERHAIYARVWGVLLAIQRGSRARWWDDPYQPALYDDLDADAR
jgi:hypothetical protein